MTCADGGFPCPRAVDKLREMGVDEGLIPASGCSSCSSSGHLGPVNRRTTVVVLGDGRNNGRPANVAALQEIARHARRGLG